MEAPPKLYAENGDLKHLVEHRLQDDYVELHIQKEHDDLTAYVRADLVKGLEDALEKIINDHPAQLGPEKCKPKTLTNAQAALDDYRKASND